MSALGDLGFQRIGLMAALNEELGDLRSRLEAATVECRAQRDYHCGRLNGQDVVAVTARVGKVAAASTATTLIERFACDAIVFVGIAGGIGVDVQVGDVVVAAQLAQHDMDASPIFPAGELPLLGVRELAPERRLTQALHQACQAAIADWSPRHDHPHFSQSNLHQGLILSGDQFVHAHAHAQELVQQWPKALAVEMEGAAVAQVCFEHSIPFAVVRTISDRADDNAATDFGLFLREVASPMSSAILRHLLG